jgi:hypothetical protein
MSQQLTPQKKPLTAEEVLATDWVARVAPAVARDGQAVRLGNGPSIEAKSLQTNQWMPIMLPSNGSTFTSLSDREKVFFALEDAIRGAGRI